VQPLWIPSLCGEAVAVAFDQLVGEARPLFRLASLNFRAFVVNLTTLELT
jgi:hypothetical protein